MITVLIGDIFESNAHTLVNTINCVGVMGKGIALEFKKHFPDMHADYVNRCELGRVNLGEPYLFRRLTPPWILNFPTKEHWRSVSRLQDIVKGLRHLERHYKEWEITSLAVPPLGCGQGQLEWRVVGPTLYRYLNRLDIPIELYAPFGTPYEEIESTFLESAPEAQWSSANGSAPYRIGPGWIALVNILDRIAKEPYHWPIGRTIFQKIAYFATESGIPTGLQYQRGSFGPYAADLKRHITALVNNGLISEERLGRMFAVKVGQTFKDASLAYQNQIEGWQLTIEKIVDLFMRMNTKQAEIAATVHFAAMELKQQTETKQSESDVLQQVMAWKQKRRPPLVQKEVALAIRNLNMLIWIDANISEDLPITEEELLHV